MIINGRTYFKPSKEARVLSLLDSLAWDTGLSQQELGRRTHLSGAMANQYLKKMRNADFLRFEPVNGKSFRYVLTPEGEEERRRMFATYSSEIVCIYTALKDSIKKRMDVLREKGIRKISLFGASETCEVVLSAIGDGPFQVVAVLDNDPEKHGKLFHGHVVSPPHVLETVFCQAVVVTSFGQQREIYEQLATYDKNFEVVRL